MSPRLISVVLALVLLVTQQLGLQHLLSHGLQTALPATTATTAEAPAGEGDAHADAAADGLCQACLALVVLGTATLPALLRWAAPRLHATAPAAPVAPAVRRGAAAPYLARAPPLRA